MDLFTYLMAKNDHNTSVNKDLFSYLLGKGQSGNYQTFTGTSISANNTKKAKMKLSLKGNTSQTGTPTPSSPIPVNVVSGDNEVIINGKNLCFDTTKPSNANLKFFINKPSQTFTISFTTNEALSNNSLYLEVDGVSKGNIGGITANANTRAEKTYTLSNENYQAIQNGTNIDILLYKNGANFTIPTDSMIENSSSASTYEPYQSQTYEVDLGTLELCKIGDYQDYFTKNSDGQWCKYNAIGKVVLDGSEAYNGGALSDSVYRFATQTYTLNSIPYTYGVEDGYSNYFKYRMEYSGNLSLERTYTTDNTAIIVTSVATSVNDLKTWLGTHNTEIYYLLKTPYLSLIEDNNLIEQLDNLQNAMSYKGTTNINQVNNDLPFEMEAEIKVSS